MHLDPCPACSRHVESDSASCPFCGQDMAHAADRGLPTKRVNRAIRFSLGAALVTVACGGSGSPDSDASTDATTDQSVKDGSNGMDAMMGSDTGSDSGSGNDASDDGPSDARADVKDATILPPYGAPPKDGAFTIV